MTEQIRDYLVRHTSECIVNAFKEKGQDVEVKMCDPCGGDNGWFLVMDSPEYDFMWHRMSFHVKISTNRPLSGGIAIEFYSGYGSDHVIRDSFPFGLTPCFGDALEKLQNRIWKHIGEDE